MLASDVPILTFHKVDSKFEFGVTRIGPERFRKAMGHLKREGYSTLPLSALRRPEAEVPDRSMVVTFDDSYESLHRNALPVLASFGFTATVFVVTGFVGSLNTWDVNLGWITFRHLSWTQLDELRRNGWEIGSHTAGHPDLTRAAPDRIRAELTESKKTLEDRLGLTVDFLSFPFGRYDDRVLSAMLESGYAKGAGFWVHKPVHKSLVFERKACYLFDGDRALRTKLEGGFLAPLEDAKLRLVNFCSHGTALVKPHRDSLRKG
jgi:peptidoglycan/xylan/chitin deacetylase (PgdA/CDA1 family)